MMRQMMEQIRSLQADANQRRREEVAPRPVPVVAVPAATPALPASFQQWWTKDVSKKGTPISSFTVILDRS